MSTITFTSTKYRKLKLAYDKARLEGKEKFTFEEEILLTDYAKYLLKYLEDLREETS